MAVPGSFPVAIGDFLEFNVVGYAVNQVSINRLVYRVSALTGAGAPLSALADLLDGALAPAYKDLMYNSASYRGILARIIYPVLRKTPYYQAKNDPGAGTAGASPLPRQTCGMITKQSTVPNPGGRGRVYVPFPSLSDQTGPDVPSAGYMTNLGVLAGRMVLSRTVSVGADSATMVPVIYKRTAPLTSNAWVASSARTAWATHRSRGDYGRPNVDPLA